MTAINPDIKVVSDSVVYEHHHLPISQTPTSALRRYWQRLLATLAATCSEQFNIHTPGANRGSNNSDMSTAGAKDQTSNPLISRRHLPFSRTVM